MTNESIIALGAARLAQAIRDGEVTAEQAVEAYIERIEAVNPVINALVADCFVEARQAARDADRALANGEAVGPLHGVPITVKEPFNVAGLRTTMGLTNRNTIQTEDAYMVHQLREAGAILLGKTNIPQCALYLEADNPMFGRTNNPHNPDRSPMGSTGGEAALVAAGGSALGLGSDLAGSVRVPPVLCGVHSIMTTPERLSGDGHAEILGGFDGLKVSFGTIARHVDDLKLALSILANHNDPKLPPVPWNPQPVDISQLTIGVFTDNRIITPSPAIRQLVDEAASVLQSAGATIVAFDPPDVREALHIYQGLVSAGGYQTIKDILKGSRKDWRMEMQVNSIQLPGAIRGIVRRLMSLLGQKLMAFNMSIIGRQSTAGYWDLLAQRDTYRETFRTAMTDQGIDVLLCPPYALPAFKHGDGYGQVQRLFHHGLNVTIAASYPVLFNVLAMPAGVIALSRVNGPESDRHAGRDLMERVAQDIEKDSTGLPIGVQIAAPPWQEDLVLEIMAFLEEQYKMRADYPTIPSL